LSRPRPEDLICEVEVLRRGRRQVVCDARIFSANDRALVAQASCIYALPPTKGT
jgi:acyl-coenzyme A thioesterase PaaI-like protein